MKQHRTLVSTAVFALLPAAWFAALAAPSVAAPDNTPYTQLTRANFDQIRDGMTEDQVVALIGPPHASSLAANRTKRLTWRRYDEKTQRDITATVHIRAIRVTWKNWHEVHLKKQ